MLKHRNINERCKNLDDLYFNQIRPTLYERDWEQAQAIDPACQLRLRLTTLAEANQSIRAAIVIATAILAEPSREENLRAAIEHLGMAELIKEPESLNLLRRLLACHHGLISEPSLERWTPLLNLNLQAEDSTIESILERVLQRQTKLFRVSLREDRGYLTSLLLSACEEILLHRGLHTLSIDTNRQTFIGEAFPKNIEEDIAQRWHAKIESVFTSNIEQLIRASPDGIKVDDKALSQDIETLLNQIDILLEKKASSYDQSRLKRDIQKHGNGAGEAAIAAAKEVGLVPVSTPEEFALSEGLKCAYLSYGRVGVNPAAAWDEIAAHTQLSTAQRTALEPFNPQYGRCLFAAGAVEMAGIQEAIADSLQQRQGDESTAAPEFVGAVKRLLNLPQAEEWRGGFAELQSYIEAKPKQRNSLPTLSLQNEKLISSKMPVGIKVEVFSNRLPGGMNSAPNRWGDSLSALSYQLQAVGANLPKINKTNPLFLHFALPKNASVELRSLWRDFLWDTTQINEAGPVTIDELKLYRDNEIVFAPHKVVGLALPKRPDLIHTAVTIPVLWGKVSAAIALLKSVRLALELALAVDVGFPFSVSSSLEIEPNWTVFGEVTRIPTTLQPLLGTGRYSRREAEVVLNRLRNLGQIALSVSSLAKKDECLAELARTAGQPFSLYYIVLRQALRKSTNPNLKLLWAQIREPLTTIMDTLMTDQEKLTSDYLKKAAHLAVVGNLRGSSFTRTSQLDPFTRFTDAIRTRRDTLDWDTIFAALVQEYHKRLDTIREYGVGATKLRLIKEYYGILRQMFAEVYHMKPQRFSTDIKFLKAAYLFYLEEARAALKETTKPNTEEK